MNDSWRSRRVAFFAALAMCSWACTDVSSGGPSVALGYGQELPTSLDVVEPEPDTTEPTPDAVEPTPDAVEPTSEVAEPEPTPDVAEPTPDVVEPTPDVVEPTPDVVEPTPDVVEPTPDVVEPTPDVVEPEPDTTEPTPDVVEPTPDVGEPTPDVVEPTPDVVEPEPEPAGPVWSDGPLSYANHSDSSDAHVISLIEAAIQGLGFPAASAQGPQPEDRWFAGRYYIAWLDRTGFVGKMNGLWRLNGASGDGLDFVLYEGERPVNFLIVGEDGDGAFPAGYPGSEHTEFPSQIPESNDNPSCGDGDWCNQFAHQEANDITDPDIPWWSACNGGTVDFQTVFEPIEEGAIDGGIRVVFEAPLVKAADGDGDFNGDACNTHWLFPDGVRRPVFLRLGYELRGDEPYVDRVAQFRNPSGNPPFDGPMSVIGGFVITQWPDPHPLKSLDRWIRPEQGELFDPAHGVTFAAGVWNDHQVPPTDGDEVFGWIGQPISLSAYPADVPGQTAHLDHIGPSDNDDVGFCLCKVHGAIEMGGGLLHGGISLPVAADSLSIEARRRLTLPGEPLSVQTYVYEAETDLFHGTGAPGGADGWSANTADHLPAHMIYGPYADDWLGISGEAVFTILIDNNDANSEGVLTLDVYDATAGQTLATQEVNRDHFGAPFVYQDFALPFTLGGLEGHAMETRVYWKANAYIEVDKVTVSISSL